MKGNVGTPKRILQACSVLLGAWAGVGRQSTGEPGLGSFSKFSCAASRRGKRRGGRQRVQLTFACGVCFPSQSFIPSWAPLAVGSCRYYCCFSLSLVNEEQVARLGTNWSLGKIKMSELSGATDFTNQQENSGTYRWVEIIPFLLYRHYCFYVCSFSPYSRTHSTWFPSLRVPPPHTFNSPHAWEQISPLVFSIHRDWFQDPCWYENPQMLKSLT